MADVYLLRPLRAEDERFGPGRHRLWRLAGDDLEVVIGAPAGSRTTVAHGVGARVLGALPLPRWDKRRPPVSAARLQDGIGGSLDEGPLRISRPRWGIDRGGRALRIETVRGPRAYRLREAPGRRTLETADGSALLRTGGMPDRVHRLGGATDADLVLWALLDVCGLDRCLPLVPWDLPV